jgi:uncharacterized repeat protein (TIGR01451 family)
MKLVFLTVSVVGLLLGPVGSVGTVAASCDPASPQADLSLTQTGSPTAGGGVLYELHVANLGPCVATGITISTLLPPGAEVVSLSANPTATGCVVSEPDADGRVRVECTLNATRGPGADVFVVFVQTTGPAGSDITNDATVTGAESDPNLGNNASSGGFVPPGGGTVASFGDLEDFVVGVPGSGFVQVKPGTFDEPCPFAGCVGKAFDLSAPSGTKKSPLVIEFRVDILLVPSGVNPRKLQVWHLPDGSTEWVQVNKPCNKGNDPCLKSIKLLTSPDFVSEDNPNGTFVQILVQSTQNGRWRT